MDYVNFEAGGEAYRLRIETRNTVALEKLLGRNPVQAIFGSGEMPTVTSLVQVLHMALQKYHHGMSMDKTFDVFDAYLADGHTPMDFLDVVLDVFKAAGLMQRDGGDSKN
jgi:hypothetical protein